MGFYYLTTQVMYLLYYFAQEAFDGKTLGKRIVGTRVVNFDGGEISVGQALGRTFCRLIPFEMFSYFSNGSKPIPWHDRITQTYVVTGRGSHSQNQPDLPVSHADELIGRHSYPLPTARKKAWHPPNEQASKSPAPLFSDQSIELAHPSAQAQAKQAPIALATDDLWENAMAECISEQRKAGLWARCFAETDGDESKAQARYIKHRVAQEQQRLIDAQSAAELLQLEQAKRDAISAEQSRLDLDSKRIKGYCPNCMNTVYMDSESCPTCKAIFGENSSYKPREIPEKIREHSELISQRRAGFKPPNVVKS